MFLRNFGEQWANGKFKEYLRERQGSYAADMVVGEKLNVRSEQRDFANIYAFEFVTPLFVFVDFIKTNLN